MKRYKLNAGFITQKIDDKTTIFAGESSKLFTLNETGSFIFQGLKLGWEKEKIIGDLVKKFNVEKKQVEKDFQELLQELLDKKIIREAN